MKSVKLLLWVLLIFSGFNSCSSDDSLLEVDLQKTHEELNRGASPYLIFGHFSGRCSGRSCVDVFRVQGDKYHEDINDVVSLNLEPFKGRFIEIERLLANDDLTMFERFPESWLNTRTGLIGTPNSNDLGGFYIEYSNARRTWIWVLDKDRRNVPRVYHKFLDEIEREIKILNKAYPRY